jgi:multiple sugar transport system ATP-binding protein
MGRAIVRHPKVFLFDEPLSNLDAKLRTQMRAEIKRQHKRLQATSVYVTHDQVEAMTLADRIVVMCDGRIEQIGTPMELFNNPVNTFVAGFIGSPPMNQFEATVEMGENGPVAVAKDARIALPALEELRGAHGRRVIVGIRPEHASIEPLPGGSTVPVELELVETLGSEALLHTTVAGTPFVIKTETGGDTDHLNGVRAMHVAAERVKVFDQESGRVLGSRKIGAAA